MYKESESNFCLIEEIMDLSHILSAVPLRFKKGDWIPKTTQNLGVPCFKKLEKEFAKK